MPASPRARRLLSRMLLSQHSSKTTCGNCAQRAHRAADGLTRRFIPRAANGEILCQTLRVRVQVKKVQPILPLPYRRRTRTRLNRCVTRPYIRSVMPWAWQRFARRAEIMESNRQIPRRMQLSPLGSKRSDGGAAGAWSRAPQMARHLPVWLNSTQPIIFSRCISSAAHDRHARALQIPKH